jgi:hypothetical protein
MTQSVDISGRRFGRLIAVRMVETGGKNRSQRWLFKCDCTNETEVSKKAVVRGDTQSCGCFRSEVLMAKSTDIAGRKFGRLTAIRMTARGAWKQRQKE